VNGSEHTEEGHIVARLWSEVHHQRDYQNLPAEKREQGRRVRVVVVKQPAEVEDFPACFREDIEPNSEVRQSSTCHENVNQNKGVRHIHRVYVICRYCGEEERRTHTVHGFQNLVVGELIRVF
jgi:hypothetical protein